jgi:enoyl-CoA hydratase/carnithine racemase
LQGFEFGQDGGAELGENFRLEGARAFFTAEDLPLSQAVEFLASQLSLNILSEDAAEGVSAFLEKRPPKWNDR